MEIINELTSLLPLEAPFFIDRVEKDEVGREVHIYLGVDKTYRPTTEYTLHSYYERTWEHLKLFQYRCFLHARVPIFEHKKSKHRQALEVPFAREKARFTLLFEAHVMDLMRLHHCFATVACSLGIYAQRVEHIYHQYTQAAYDGHTITPCQRIGVDETSTRRGHDYITVFVDLDTHEPLFVEPGRDGQAFKRFFEAHPNPAVIREVSMDMSPAFIKAARAYLPWCGITFDKWHVFRLFDRHLEQACSEVREQAFEHLHAFYETTDMEQGQAHLAFLADYIEDALGKNSLSRSIRRHFDGLVNYVRSRLTNGVLEGINNKIQLIKRVARGFRKTEHLMKMIWFVFGRFQPTTPSRII